MNDLINIGLWFLALSILTAIISGIFLIFWLTIENLQND